MTKMFKALNNFAQDGCSWLPVVACFCLSGLFVGSLYVWDSKHDRNHPSTIKQRFCSVFVVILISPFIVRLFINSPHLKKFTIFELLGFRLPGIYTAGVIPLILTMVLFLGPLYMHDDIHSWRILFSVDYWLHSVTDLIWLRNIIVGPLAEEFTFRVCMVPLLIQCLSPLTTVFVCSFFFGLAHVHHFVERYKAGDPVNILAVKAFVQFSYTTLFGAYSALVFLQTGHFIAPFIIHSFCNAMSFPDFGKIFTYENPKRTMLIVIYVFGVVLWCFLLPRLLDHTWYDNYVYYNKMKVS